MSLDPDYLAYAKRGRGMDHDLYPVSNLFERPPVAWPGAARVAIWPVISLEWFPITPVDKPFRAPGHMQTPYPDYRHYTSRDYGARVGVYRLLDALAKVGACASFAVNAAVAERYPALIKDVLAAGHEIIAHSTDMIGTSATGLDEADERALIKGSLDRLERACGQRPKGWHSIARSQSWNTPRLLAEAGVDFMCDWGNDELPFAMTTAAGEIINIPLNHELSDRQILIVQQQSVASYAEQMRDAFGWLDGEAKAAGAGRMLPLAITPYIMGLPYRIGAFEDVLAWLASRDGAWFATGGEVLDAWRG